jgi:histidinol-phosphatase
MKTEEARWTPFLHSIANVTDDLALRYFRSPDLRVDFKPDRSPVTEADRTIEDAVRGLVARDYPQLGILGEERDGPSNAEEMRLIVDPIDATKNFIRGIPIFATLLAIEKEGGLVAGLVSAPALGSRWYADRGLGAFCDRRPLHVSNIASIADAQLFHTELRDENGEFMPDHHAALFRRFHRTRGFGDFYQHVLVAEGAGELAFDPIVHPWDVAPLIVIIEEAGGRATDVNGQQSVYGGSLVTSNGLVHDEALRLLAAGNASC